MSATYAPPHVQRVLGAFENVRVSGSEWSARCPAHKDRKNSLCIGIGENGAVVLHCQAGCDPGMVLYHKGLTFADLYPPRDETAASNGFGHAPDQQSAEPPPTGETPEREGAGPKAKARVIKKTRYELRTPSGELVAFHVRLDFDDDTKSMWYEDPAGNKTLNGKPKADLPLYGIHALGDAKVAIVCEGEKAAEALRDLGIPAVGTATGADGCPCDDSLRPLLGLKVVFWPDNDAPGRPHVDGMGEALRRLGQRSGDLFLLDWRDAPPKGDAADFVERHPTKEAVNELLRSAARWQPAPAGASSSAGTAAGPAQSAAASGGSGPTPGKGPSQATLLVALAREGASDLFHDPTGQGFITFGLNGHRETWPLVSRNVREWLSRKYYEAHKTSPGGDALKNALTTLGGIATFDGACREVFVRLGGQGGDVYLDLGTPSWEVVRIRASGWDVIPGSEAPVRFRRPRGLLPLPRPESGGDLSVLRRLINFVDDDGFDLVVGWLVGALNPRGTYPILVYSGEQGSAKTTAARLTRACIDPNVAPLRSQPREEGDVLIAASNGLVVGYDNLSKLPDWLSDALCRLTSGGGVGKRQLFTDGDEFILDARRPALLTGIESVLSRGDAIDRALLVELQTMTKGQRRTEAAIWAAFEAAHAGILGALLDAASTALRELPNTHIDELPRLADFACWVEAAAPALGWKQGRFLQVYNGNRDNADEVAIDASAIGPMLRGFLAELGEGGVWEGTASELLVKLNERASEAAKKEQDWPKRANSLSGQVKRLAPHLRRIGYDVQTGYREGHERRRVMRLANISAKHRPHRPQESDDSRNRHEDGDSDANAADDPTTQGSSATAPGSSAPRPHHEDHAGQNLHHQPDFSGDADEADEADDVLHNSWENAPSDCARPWECGDRGPCPGYGESCPLAAATPGHEPSGSTLARAVLVGGM